MKKSPPLLTALFLVLVNISLYSQTAFWTDDFETTNSSSGSRIPENDGGFGGPPFNSYFCRTPATGTVNQNVPFTGFQGSNYWAGEDHNRSQLSWVTVDNQNVREQRIDWTGINITGRTGLSFTGSFAANSTSTAFDNRSSCAGGPTGNNTDYIIVQRSIDGGPFVDMLRFFTRGGTGVNRYLYQENTGDSCGDGTQLVNVFAPFSATITGTGTTMALRLLVYSEANNEEWGIDNFRLFSSLTATQSQVNLVCNSVCNGSASVVAGGGTQPYTYSWAPSGGTGATASNLCAGVYTCTITDALSAQITRTFNITEPTAIIVTPVSQTDNVCSGGSIGTASVTASGGTGGLTYDWTPGNPSGDGTPAVTGLTAGLWTCTVTDASLCTSTATFNILEPAALAVSITPVSGMCTGENRNLVSNVSGGTGPYSYNWMPGGMTTANVTVAPVSTTGYTLTVTDANGCTSTAQTTVTVLPCATTTVPCGVTIVNKSQSLSAANVLGAVQYRFRFYDNVTLAPVATVTQASRTLSFANIGNLLYGTTYRWTVSVDVGAGFGPQSSNTCTIRLAIPQTTLLCNVSYDRYSAYSGVPPIYGSVGYRYTFYNASTMAVVTQFTQASNYLFFNNIPQLVVGSTYRWTVEVQYFNGTANVFGPSSSINCMVTMTAPSTTVPCNNTYVRSTGYAGATAVPSATGYRFRFYQGSTLVATRAQTSNYLTFNQVGGLLDGQTYQWTVEVLYNPGPGNVYGPASTPCNITFSGVARMHDNTEEPIAQADDFSFAMSMYPNPLGDGVNPTVVISNADQRDAVVTVTDITGRVVTTYRVFCEGNEYAAQLNEFPELVAGMYIMQVQIGDQVKSQKFIAE